MRGIFTIILLMFSSVALAQSGASGDGVRRGGDIPEVSATRCSITVNYVKAGMTSGLCSKTFAMTINNGKAPEYTDKTVVYESGSMLEAAVADEFYAILKKLTISRELECIFDTVAIIF
jgi:hypothetical protein